MNKARNPSKPSKPSKTKMNTARKYLEKEADEKLRKKMRKWTLRYLDNFEVPEIDENGNVKYNPISVSGLKELEKEDRKQALETRLCEQICDNPFVITPITLNEATKLYKSLKLNVKTFEEKRLMGEFLRRCHYKYIGKKFDADNVNKDDYDTDIAFPIPESKVDIFSRYSPEYNLVVNKIRTKSGEETYIIQDINIARSEDKVSDFLINKTTVIRGLEDISRDTVRTHVRGLGKDSTENLENAVTTALKNPVSCITGEAGTGKTLAIETIIDICKKKSGVHFHVCSFTGKAIDNIKERAPYTNENAFTTIHSLWGKYKSISAYLEDNRDIEGKEELYYSNISEDKRIEYKHPDIFINGGILIVEEASMASTQLLSQLFGAIVKYQELEHHPIQLIFIGDTNQLPPITPGKAFECIIASNRFPIRTLSKNWRVEKSKKGKIIINNARCYTETWDGEILQDPDHYSIKQGKEKEEYKESYGKVVSYCEEPYIKEIAKCYKRDLYETCVISPWNKRRQKLNRAIQRAFPYRYQSNKTLPHMKLRIKFDNGDNEFWYRDDKVVLTRNCGISGIYNGSVGKIVSINERKEVEIKKGDYRLYEYLPPSKNKDIKSFVQTKDSRSFIARAMKVKFRNGTEYIFPFFRVSEKDQNTDELDDESELDKYNKPPTISDITLAYCVTTHKMQGSEAETVYFDCYWDSAPLKIPGGIKNVYTAITRTKNKFVWYGKDLDHVNPKLFKPIYETHDRLTSLLTSSS